MAEIFDLPYLPKAETWAHILTFSLEIEKNLPDNCDSNTLIQKIGKGTNKSLFKSRPGKFSLSKNPRNSYLHETIFFKVFTRKQRKIRSEKYSK